MKQLEKADVPKLDGYEALSGNKEAKEAADKVKAALDAIPVDRDALLLAERNDVLDAAIERLSGGKAWTVQALVKGVSRSRLQKVSPSFYEVGSDMIVNAAVAAVMRDGTSFCLIGALGSQEGIHSHEAIDAAVSAVDSVVRPIGVSNPSYGYTHGGVWQWNDDQEHAGPVIAALRAAKNQPLRKSYCK